MAAAQAAKNAHPRIWLTSARLGAVDGTTSGSLRWKAVQHTADWEKFRADAEQILTSQTGGAACTAANTPTGGWGGVNGLDSAIPLALMTQILENMTVTTDTPYTAAQYANCAEVLTESYHNGYVVPLACPSGNYANCNSCSHPPTGDGNKFRQQFKRYAIIYDWLMGSSFPPTSGHQTDWINDLHQSGEATINAPCWAGDPSHTNYSAGTGPAQNVGGLWDTVYMIGVATYGANPTDTSTCPTQGGIHETQCNDETTAYLNNFVNNWIPWWTINALGTGGTNQCQPPVNPTSVGAYAGGKGCGVGGSYSDGLEYFPQQMHYIFEALATAVTADNPSIDLWGAMPSYFTTDQANYLMYGTSPTYSKRWQAGAYMYEFDNHGDQENAAGSLYALNESLQTAAQILADKLGNTTIGNYIRFWVDSIYKNQSTGGPLYGIYPGHGSQYTSWEYLIWENNGLGRTDYRTQLTPTYHASGEDETISFAKPAGSSCTQATNFMACPDATWAIFSNREVSTNHAHNDTGEFDIWRKSAWVALGPVGYFSSNNYILVDGQSHNIATYQGTSDLALGIFRGSETFPKSGVSAFNVANELNSPYYVYSWVNTTGNYKNLFSSNPIKVQREYIHFYPDRFVILDRGTFNTATSGRFQVSAPGSIAPSTSGAITTMTSPGNKDGLGGTDQALFLTPLYPAGQSTAFTNYDGGISAAHVQNSSYAYGSSQYPSSGANSYLVQKWYRYGATTPSTSTAFIMLNGMEVADTGATATASEALTPSGLICDHWKDSTRDDVACFSSDTGGALLTLPVSTYTYTPSATASRHIIVDLPINTAVKVAVTRGATNSYTINTSGGSGTVMTTSTQGVLSFADNGTTLSQLNNSGSAVCGITGPSSGQLADGTIGVSYTPVTITTANCTSPSFSFSAGSPAGLVINSSSGIISGTPTGPAQNNSFSVNITDANGNTSNNYTIQINNPAAAPGTSVVGGNAAFGGKSNH